jgi:hypothetical protein
MEHIEWLGMEVPRTPEETSNVILSGWSGQKTYAHLKGTQEIGSSLDLAQSEELQLPP